MRIFHEHAVVPLKNAHNPNAAPHSGPGVAQPPRNGPALGWRQARRLSRAGENGEGAQVIPHAQPLTVQHRRCAKWTLSVKPVAAGSAAPKR